VEARLRVLRDAIGVTGVAAAAAMEDGGESTRGHSDRTMGGVEMASTVDSQVVEEMMIP
jgi:hypothetical protein